MCHRTFYATRFFSLQFHNTQILSLYKFSYNSVHFCIWQNRINSSVEIIRFIMSTELFAQISRVNQDVEVDDRHARSIARFHVLVDDFRRDCQGPKLLLTVNIALAGEGVVNVDLQAV